MSTPPEVPADVREATQRHLAALDMAAPGLVTSLYLTGSVTLGDYQPGRSDIDFMAFTTRPVTEPGVVALLAGVHASLPDTVKYDGNYLVAWVATGAARLHYTLATGDITSKSGAGSYAIEHFPAYTEVVTGALAWRATGDGEFTVADWCRAAQLTLDIITDANRRWG